MNQKAKKRLQKDLHIILLAAGIVIASGCGNSLSVCDCMKDDGSNKNECSKLMTSISTEEKAQAIKDCK